MSRSRIPPPAAAAAAVPARRSSTSNSSWTARLNSSRVAPISPAMQTTVEAVATSVYKTTSSSSAVSMGSARRETAALPKAPTSPSLGLSSVSKRLRPVSHELENEADLTALPHATRCLSTTQSHNALPMGNMNASGEVGRATRCRLARGSGSCPRCSSTRPQAQKSLECGQVQANLAHTRSPGMSHPRFRSAPPSPAQPVWAEVRESSCGAGEDDSPKQEVTTQGRRKVVGNSPRGMCIDSRMAGEGRRHNPDRVGSKWVQEMRTSPPNR